MTTYEITINERQFHIDSEEYGIAEWQDALDMAVEAVYGPRATWDGSIDDEGSGSIDISLLTVDGNAVEQGYIARAVAVEIKES